MRHVGRLILTVIAWCWCMGAALAVNRILWDAQATDVAVLLNAAVALFVVGCALRGIWS